VSAYRIRNPANGVTEVLPPETASERPSGRFSVPPPRASGPAAAPGRFSAPVYFAAAEMLALEGHIKPALRAAERGMKLEDPGAEMLALHAWLLYRRDRLSTAHVSGLVWNEIDRALATDASCALAHYFKSVLLQRSGQTHEARWHLHRGRELDPDQRAADRALALLDDE
jgi:hypothetical protein